MTARGKERAKHRDEVPSHTCLKCGKVMDTASDVFDNQVAGVGDLSICAYCGNVAMYGPDFKLVEVTMAEIPASERIKIILIQAAIHARRHTNN